MGIVNGFFGPNLMNQHRLHEKPLSPFFVSGVERLEKADNLIALDEDELALVAFRQKPW